MLTFDAFCDILYANCRRIYQVYPPEPDSGNTVGISFKSSKRGEPPTHIYWYRGTYVEVLNQVGILAIEWSRLRFLQAKLEQLKAENGMLAEDPQGRLYTQDNSRDIQNIRQELALYSASNVIRV